MGCGLVSQSCPTLYDLMDCSMPGFPVLHYLLKFSQTHGPWVQSAICCLTRTLPPTLVPFLFSEALNHILKVYVSWTSTPPVSFKLFPLPRTPSMHGQLEKKKSQTLEESKSIHRCIYTYMCVCVCLCVCVYINPKHVYLKRYMHPNVHSSVIYDCQDMEAT